MKRCLILCTGLLIGLIIDSSALCAVLPDPVGIAPPAVMALPTSDSVSLGLEWACPPNDGVTETTVRKSLGTALVARKPQPVNPEVYRPGQDDPACRPRSAVVGKAPAPADGLNPKPTWYDRSGLRLSQAWAIPHRPGSLHRVTHY
ncbi:hypothetical protein GCM10027578_22190 [Spirosoma luteolum]